MPWDLAYLEQGWADAVILPPGARISMRGSMTAKRKGGRALREGLVPRWMAFPPSNYTARCGVGTVAAHAMAFAALEREGPAENESEAEDETGAEGEAVGGPEIEGGTETGPETEAAESSKQASDVAGFGAPEADSGEVEATDGKSPEPSASGLFLTEGAENFCGEAAP